MQHVLGPKVWVLASIDNKPVPFEYDASIRICRVRALMR